MIGGFYFGCYSWRSEVSIARETIAQPCCYYKLFVIYCVLLLVCALSPISYCNIIYSIYDIYTTYLRHNYGIFIIFLYLYLT